MIKWDATKAEIITIGKIAHRAVKMADDAGIGYEYQDAMMDIEATHCNGCKLKLDVLLEADDFNFAHDVFGIRSHIDRETGELTGHFLPRTAE